MKKVLIILPILIVILFVGGYALLFTQSGNNLLIPTINSYLLKKIDGAKVEITSFTLNPSHLKVNATVNSLIDIDSDGDFSIFDKSIDMIYTINAKKIDTPEFKLDQEIYIKGKIIGDMTKTLIFGVGKIASSPLEYKLNLVDNNPKNISAKIQDANLENLLLIAGQKPYASGEVNLVIDMPNITTGKIKVNISNGAINSKLLKKDFQIELPNNSTFQTNINGFIKNSIANFNSTTITSLGNITTSNGSYHVKNKKFGSDYAIEIKNLADLKSITKQNFKGQFKANGVIKQDSDKLFVSLNSKSFGGRSELYFDGDKLKAILTNISSKTLLYKLNQPSYLDSKIDSTIDIKSIKNTIGSYTLKINGQLNKSLIKRLYSIDLPIGSKITISSTGKLKNSTIQSSANLLTTIGAIKVDELIYELKNSNLKSLRVTTPIIGGITKVNLHDNRLSLLLKDVDSKKALILLNQPLYFNGLINSNVTIDNIKNLDGKFDFVAGGIVSNDILEGSHKIDIKTSGTIANKIVSLPTTTIKSKLFNLDLQKLNYNIDKNILTALYHVKSDDLSTLNKLTSQKLKGSLAIDGNIVMKKDLIVKGHSDKFDGTIDFTLKNSDLTAYVKNASVLKITNTLSYPKYIQGIANANLKYNLESSKGVANINMDKAKLLPTKLTSLITKLKGTDLTAEHFNKTTLQARLSKNLVDFDFDAKSRSLSLSIKNGKIREPGGKLDALLDVNIEGDKYKAKVYGTTQKPKIKLDSSALRAKAKEKAKEKIREKVEDEIKKRLNIDKIDKDLIIKGLIKKLF